MKTQKPCSLTSRVSRTCALAAALALLAGNLPAANYYWDANGTTAGLGGSTSGTWGTSAFQVSGFPSVIDGTTGSFSATATTASDSITFGTINLSLTNQAATIGIAAIGVTNNIITFGLGQTNAVLLNGGGGSITMAGTTPTISVMNPNIVNTIGAVLAGTGGLTLFGPGTLTLTNAETYTGGTIVSGGVTLNVGNGSAGSLTSQALAFNAGGGLFNVAEAASSSQSMGALTFSAGEGTVQSTYPGSGNSTLTFSSLAARTAGASGNFVISGGANGSTETIVLTGASSGVLLDKGLFFGGSSYAAYDSGGYVRAYGSSDANYLAAPAGATMGSPTATSNVQLTTGNITAQTSASANTINLGANSLIFQNAASTLSVNGILSAGASSAVITSGTSASALQATSAGGELLVRVNGSTDALNIGANIQNNTSASSLTKSGAGTLTLSGTNTYTGTTTVNAGTLALSGGAALSSTAPVVLANAPGVTLLLTNNNQTIGNVNGGGFSGGNVNVGTNVLTIAAASGTFGGQITGASSGGLTVNGGTLTLANKNSFAGTLTLNGSSQLTLTYGNEGSSNPEPLSSGGTISLAGGTTLNLSPVTSVAAGVLLGGVQNIYGGWLISNPINVSSGTATVNGNTGNDQKYVFSGGVTGGTSGTQTFAFNQGGSSIGGGGDRDDMLFSGVMANGSGGVLGATFNFTGASGSGQDVYICLRGSNTFTGPLIVNNSRGLTYAQGSTGGYLVIGGDIVHQAFGARTVTVGSGYLGGGNYTNTISLAAGTVLDYVSSNNLTLSGVISGGGSVALEGTGIGTLTLSGANTYTNLTTIIGGKLVMVTGSGTRCASAVTVNNTAGCIFGVQLAAANGQWASSSDLTVGGASSELDIDFNGLAPSASVDPVQVRNLTVNGTGTLKILGNLSQFAVGTYPLINFTGIGPATTNSYTGLTLSLPVGVSGSLTVTANHVNLVVTGVAKNLSWNTGNANWDTGTPWYDGVGSAAFTPGDFVTFDDASGVSGNPTVTVSGASVAPAGMIIMNSTTHDYTIGGNSIAGSGGLMVNASGHTLTLTATNNNTGNTTVSNGTLVISGQQYFQVGRTTTINAGGTLNLTNSVNTFTTLMPVSTINGSGTFRLSGNSTINQSSGGSSGNRLTFAMTGGTIDLQGTAQLVNGGWQELYWANNKSSLNIAAGAKFDMWDGQAVYVDALTGSGTIDKNQGNGATGTLTLGVNNGSGIFTGIIKNTQTFVALTKTGTGTQTLAGNNSYTGATTISGGTLTIGGAGQLGSGTYAGNIINNSVFNFGSSASQTLSGIISGTGSLINSGTLTLSGANTYSGGTTISAGALQIGNGGNITATVAGTITLNGGALFYNFSADNFGVNGNINLNADSTIGNLSTHQINLGGTFNGAGHSLTISNNPASNLLLYFGQTHGSDLSQVIISSGAAMDSVNVNFRNTSMIVSNGAALWSYGAFTNNSAIALNGGAGPSAGNYGAIRNQGNGTVAYSGTITLNSGNSSIGTDQGNINMNGVIAGGGSLTKINANTLTLSGTNTYTGTTTISGGTLTIGGAGQLGSGTYAGNITDNATFAYASSAAQTLSGAITGTGTLSFSGTGTLTLTGNNSYTGTTTVNGGTLLVNGNNLAATGAVTVLANATFGGTGSVGGVVGYQNGSLASFTVIPEVNDSYNNSNYMTFTNAVFMTNVTVKVSMPANLGNGVYVLATNYVTPTLSGTLTFATNSGSLGAGGTGVVSISGNNLILTVSGVTGGIPATTLALTAVPGPTNSYNASVSYTAQVQTNGTTATAATGSVIFSYSTYGTNAAVAFSTNTLGSGVANSLSISNQLPRGTNLIIAAYPGDVNYLGSTNTLIQTVTNHPPVVSAITMGALSGTPATILIIGGKYAPTDADGDPLIVSAVQNPSTHGGTVTTDGTNVTYTALNTFTGADTFTYSVSDNYGGTSTAVITVNVVTNGGGYNLISGPVNNGNGTSTINFAGIPGYSYALETTPSLTLPITWTPVQTNTAASNGALSFTFSTASGQGYFRTHYLAN